MIPELIAKLEASYAIVTPLYHEQSMLAEKNGTVDYSRWPDKADEMRMRGIIKQCLREQNVQYKLMEEIDKLLNGCFCKLPDGRHVSSYCDSDYGICIQILEEYKL